VIVGHDDAGRIDDEAGADGLSLGMRPHLALALLAKALGELVHELFHLLLGRAIRHLHGLVVALGLHGHGHVDHGRRHLGGEVGEVVRHRLAGHGRGRREQGSDQGWCRERRRQRQGRQNAGFGLGHFKGASSLLARGICVPPHGAPMAATLNVCIVGGRCPLARRQIDGSP